MASPHLEVKSVAPKLVAGSIILSREGWYGHIKKRHPDVVLWQLKDTLKDPCYVCLSTTVPGAYVFICEGNTNEYGDPLVVTVMPQTDGSNIVTTAYYDQDYWRHQPQLWRRGDA